MFARETKFSSQFGHQPNVFSLVCLFGTEIEEESEYWSHTLCSKPQFVLPRETNFYPSLHNKCSLLLFFRWESVWEWILVATISCIRRISKNRLIYILLSLKFFPSKPVINTGSKYFAFNILSHTLGSKPNHCLCLQEKPNIHLNLYINRTRSHPL